MSSHLKSIPTKNEVIYLQSFYDTYLAPTQSSHLILTRAYFFLLSHNNDFFFFFFILRSDIVSYVNDVIKNS